MLQQKLISPLALPVVPGFVGRARELRAFEKLNSSTEAQILVVYGRRRIGKTSLIQKSFRDRNLLKFEGLEHGDQTVQRENFLEQLARYSGDVRATKLQPKNWRDVFIELAPYISKGQWTVYLEELQWMARYKSELISDLKYVWDNYWSANPALILILCGSSPSFIINKVMLSKALHNRSQREFPISELSILEAQTLLGANRSQPETLDAYLAVGGVPEYLKRLKEESSTYLALCNNSFKPGGYFLNEAERIFVSSLGNNPLYRATLSYLANNGPTAKSDLLKAVRYPSGGKTSEVFTDLEKCNFIGTYSPLKFGTATRGAKIYLRDPYLHFYYRFIQANAQAISRGEFESQPTALLPHADYRQWLGYAFERFCLQNHRLVAKILGFDAVKYDVGPYYHRGDRSAAQVDLVFRRKDQVLTVCELKYKQTPPGEEVIDDFEKKLSILKDFEGYSLQKVVISPQGVTQSLRDSGYFDQVVTIHDIFNFVGL